MGKYIARTLTLDCLSSSFLEKYPRQRNSAFVMANILYLFYPTKTVIANISSDLVEKSKAGNNKKNPIIDSPRPIDIPNVKERPAKNKAVLTYLVFACTLFA